MTSDCGLLYQSGWSINNSNRSRNEHPTILPTNLTFARITLPNMDQQLPLPWLRIAHQRDPLSYSSPARRQ